MATQEAELKDFTPDNQEALLADLDGFDSTEGLDLEEGEPEQSIKERTKRPNTSEEVDKFHKNLDATQLYLNEIGFSPLLTAEEEVYFSRKALRGCLRLNQKEQERAVLTRFRGSGRSIRIRRSRNALDLWNDRKVIVARLCGCKTLHH